MYVGLRRSRCSHPDGAVIHTGSYNFVVPSDLAASPDYTIALVWMWGASEIKDFSNAFSVLSTNVALGASVTDTSDRPWTAAGQLDKIVDGSAGTRVKWPPSCGAGNMCHPWWTDASGTANYGYSYTEFNLDLGQPFEITTLVMKWWWNDVWGSHVVRPANSSRTPTNTFREIQEYLNLTPIK